MLAEETQAPISVVIPVRNGAATLGAQLAALAAQRSAPPFQTIISDNGSEDDLCDVLADAKRKFPNLDIKYVDASEKKGAGHARNVGAGATSCDIILFCDSDDVVSRDWVRAMVDGLTHYDSVGGALDESYLNSRWAQQQTFASTSLPLGLGFLPYPMGSNCGVRRDVWKMLSGFDVSYTLGGEEVEFFWRLQLAGYSLGFIPEAVVYYRHRTDIIGNMRQAFRHGISSCQLAAAFRLSLPPESIIMISRAWLRLSIRLPLLAIPQKRLGYLRVVAHKAGQVVGSMRYRVLHLA